MGSGKHLERARHDGFLSPVKDGKLGLVQQYSGIVTAQLCHCECVHIAKSVAQRERNCGVPERKPAAFLQAVVEGSSLDLCISFLVADALHAFSTWFAERGSFLDDWEIASAVELPRNDTVFGCG